MVIFILIAPNGLYRIFESDNQDHEAHHREKLGGKLLSDNQDHEAHHREKLGGKLLSDNQDHEAHHREKLGGKLSTGQ
ncbi:hypothetical protein RRG08_029265 [Elysia crispata]|uniref:Uncharacterized protein n=1 Tax=Elysia crispata TaxID=231223 RepID=A0AAE1E0X6_9GAST|nr:hypothetical protein RRG08_029265 [Elysia crispata]